MIKKLLSFYFLLFISFISFSQETYYDDVNLTLTGVQLKAALTTKVTTTHTNKLVYTPGVWEASKITDENSSNTSEVVLIYGWSSSGTTARTRDKSLQQGSGGSAGRWNREHVYSQSLATPNFSTSQPGPGTDAHNLRPADSDRNSLRSNKKFSAGSGNSAIVDTHYWYPGDEWKGDVARMMMYMYVRYGSQCLPTGVAQGSTQFTPDDMIDLFLQWNVEDPVSDLEKARNTFHEDTANNTYAQGNRNPFIDNPYLATRIWGGDSAQDLWGIYTGSDTEAPTTPTNVVASNQTSSTLDISWTASTDNEAVTGYNVYVDGTLTYQTANTTYQVTGLTPNTSYAIQIEAKDLINNKSAKSTVLNASTTTDTNAPSVPTALVANNIAGTTFKLTWTASTDDTAVTGYDVYVDDAFHASTTTNPYTVTGLTASTTYAITILAKDAADNKSAQSTAINVTTTDGASNGVSDLFFSQYIEGGNNNKALEIVNLTGSAVNLTGYTIKKQSNGAGDWINAYDISSGSVTTLNVGEVLVLINGQADNAVLIAEADIVVPNDGSFPYGAPVNFNGNDAVGLFKNDVLVDVIGEVDNGNKHIEDVTLVRKSDVNSPNTTYTSSEWEVLGKDDTTGLGSHTSTLSVEKLDNAAFKMYPNPLTGNYLNFVQVNSQRITAIKIYNTVGQEVISIENPKNTVNLNGLKSGIYIVKFYSENKIGIKKLIKQ